MTDVQTFRLSMGQNLITILAHPLTGTAVQIVVNWISTLPQLREKAVGERILLQIMHELGYDLAHLKKIMPEQQDFINNIDEVQGTSELEKRLSPKGRVAFRVIKRELELQLKKNEKIEKYFQASPTSGIKMPNEYAENAMKAAEKNCVDRVNFYNFAFVGHTNNGKSAMINAIFGLNKDDKGAAMVDIHETTHEIKYYSNPNMPNIRFYDIPGAGSSSHRAKDYYTDKALCGFDCLVIFVQQALMEEEIEFAKAALKYNQKVVFVRSKCDLDFHLRNEDARMLNAVPSTEDIQNHIDELRRVFSEEIKRYASELSLIDCFFVSAKAMRARIRGEIADMVFEETKFLEYLYDQSKKARGVKNA